MLNHTNAQWISPNDSVLPRADLTQILGHWNNKIFLFSGNNYPNQLVVFDVDTENFTDYGDSFLSVNLRGQGHYFSVNSQINDQLFIPQYNTNLTTQVIFIFNLSSTDFHIPIANISASPVGHITGCLVAKDDHPYLYSIDGHEYYTGLFAYRYDILNSTWNEMPEMESFSSWRGYPACIIDQADYLWVIGGLNVFGGYDASIEKILITSDAGRWRYNDYELITLYQRYKAVLYDEMIYVMGGNSVDPFGNDLMQIINTRTGVVSLSPDQLSYATGRGVAGIVDHTIYLFGGNVYEGNRWSKYELQTLYSTSAAPTTPSSSPSISPSNPETQKPTNSPITTIPSSSPHLQFLGSHHRL